MSISRKWALGVLLVAAVLLGAYFVLSSTSSDGDCEPGSSNTECTASASSTISSTVVDSNSTTDGTAGGGDSEEIADAGPRSMRLLTLLSAVLLVVGFAMWRTANRMGAPRPR